jgi:hypothetical protein
VFSECDCRAILDGSGQPLYPIVAEPTARATTKKPGAGRSRAGLDFADPERIAYIFSSE